MQTQMMWKQSKMVLAALVLGLCASCASSTDVPPDSQIRSDLHNVIDERELVVLTRTSAEADKVVAQSARSGYTLIERSDLPDLDMVMLVLLTPTENDGPTSIREIEAIETGVIAGVNHAYTTQSTASLAGGRHYADTLLNWPSSGCPAYLSIGVIDTDIPAGLAGPESRLIKRDFTRSARAETSDHGEAMVRIILGEGRLTDAELYHAAVVARSRSGAQSASVDSLVLALNWLVSADVGVINISLAGPYNKILDRAVDRTLDRGVLIVAAAGNNGHDSPPKYPAAFDEVVAVTAIDAAENVFDRAVIGPHIDLSAPGVDVFLPVGEGGKYMSGTSIAAAFITAYIAAEADAGAARSGDEVVTALSGHTKDLGALGKDPVYGAGLPQRDRPC